MGIQTKETFAAPTPRKMSTRAGDPIAIASYLGSNDSFDRAVAVFAESYADQNERDYDALKQAVETGSIKAETGI